MAITLRRVNIYLSQTISHSGLRISRGLEWFYVWLSKSSSAMMNDIHIGVKLIKKVCETIKKWIIKNKQIDHQMLRYSILFFTFFLLLYIWKTNEINQLVTISYIRYGWHPIRFDNFILLTSARFFSALLFIIFFIAIFIKYFSDVLQGFNENPIFWFLTGFTFCVSFFRGAGNVPEKFYLPTMVIGCLLIVIILGAFIKSIVKFIKKKNIIKQKPD